MKPPIVQPSATPARGSFVKLIFGIWYHLSRKRKLQFFLLLGIMIAGSLAELMSIGAVLPLLGVLTVPEKVFDHPYAQPFVSFFNIETPQELILPTVILFGFAAVASGLIRLLMIYATTRYSYAVGADISVDMYRRTLYQPYAVHVKKNSSELIAGISSKSAALTGSVLMPVLNLLSSLFFTAGVLLALAAIDPTVTAIAFLLVGGIYLLISAVTKQGLKRNSETVSRETVQVIKSLQEGLGGIREVLIDGTQELHCKIFQAADHPLRLAHGYNHFISASPRYVIETVGMIAIAAFAYVASGQPGGIVGALPVLGALALGAQRLLPIFQQGYAAFSTIRGASSPVWDVLEVLDQPLPEGVEDVGTISFKSGINLDKVSFRYDAEMPVLDNISIRLKKGGRYGFAGATGSGKSTLLDIVMGLLEPTGGTFSIDGQEITKKNRRSWQKHIAHVPQVIFLSDATIAENIAFGVPLDQIDHARVTAAAKQAQIAHAIESWPLKYETIVGELGTRLSGGQRQRIGIARALYKQAEVLVFDEATSALDDGTEQAVMEAIESLSDELTILIVAHRLSTLNNCDEVFELVNGQIAKGSRSKMTGKPTS